jgi:hypothetical protein
MKCMGGGKIANSDLFPAIYLLQICPQPRRKTARLLAFDFVTHDTLLLVLGRSIYEKNVNLHKFMFNLLNNNYTEKRVCLLLEWNLQGIFSVRIFGAY